jgi:hypothetical protein
MLLNSLLHGIIFQWIILKFLSQISNGLTKGFAFSDSFISLCKMRIVHGWEVHMTWGSKHNLETYCILMGIMFWIFKLIMFWWALCFESSNLACFDGRYVLNLQTYHVLMGIMFLNLETYHVLMGVMFLIFKLIMFWWALCFESWNLDRCYVSSLICSYIELPWTSLPKVSRFWQSPKPII